MIKLFLLLQRGRLQKKKSLYKQVWNMTFDPMLLFYVLALFTYIAWAVYQTGNIGMKIDQFTFQLEVISIDVFWMMMTVVPLGLLFRTFTRPGIVISTAEYRASLLPYTKRQIWWMAVIFRWLKLAVILSIVGFFLYVASPTSGQIVLLYIALLWLINMLMTSIEWRVFQLHFIWKSFIFITVIGVNIMSFMTEATIVGAVAFISLIVLNLFLLPRTTKKIAWEKVTAACDYQVWNMPLMTYFTKQKMKKERAYTIWQRVPFWRKAFPYRKEAVYGRLWFIYWQRQVVLVLQFLGTIILLTSFIPLLNMWIIEIVDLFGITVLPVKDWLFFVTLVVGMHLYISMAVVFWRDRLTTDIMQILPWDVVTLQTTFLKWAYPGIAIFLFPMYIYALEHASWLFILQMLIALCAVTFLLYWKLVEAFQIISEKETFAVPKKMLRFGYSLYLVIIVSEFYPLVMIIGIILATVVITLHMTYRSQITAMSNDQN